MYRLPVGARTRTTQRLALLVASALLLGSGILATGGPVVAQGGIDSRLARGLQDVIDQARPARGVPGISAAVATAGDIWTGVTGKARFDPDQPVRIATPFSIGSVTKTFVATVIMELRQEGKLSLGDRLSTWETHVPNAARITIRQLLSHTSGVRDMWWNPKYHALVEGRPGHVWTYADARDMIGPSRFTPGTAFEYSNSNYLLLGRIIELVTSNSVAHEIRTRLLDPLHLDDTWYQGAETGPRVVAMGYQRRSGRWVTQGDGTGLRPTTSIATFFGAAGAMVSTAHDLALWARALYGGHVLEPASLRLMTTFNHNYGLGTRRQRLGDRTAWGHGGSLDGFETGLWYLPSVDASVVLMWNRRELDPVPTIDKLARRVVQALDPSVTPPTAGVPRLTMHQGATVSSGYVPVVVTWDPARDGPGAVIWYQASRRSAGGAWQALRLASAGSRRVSLTLRVDRGTVVAIRAKDDSRNARTSWSRHGPHVVWPARCSSCAAGQVGPNGTPCAPRSAMRPIRASRSTAT